MVARNKTTQAKGLEARFSAAMSSLGLRAKTPTVLMVSGGADSTALARLFAGWRAGESGAGHELAPAVIVHVNHHLRGEAAEQDAAFVVGLGRELELPVVVHDADVAAMAASGAGGGNVEAAGRQERYRVARLELERLCAAAGAPLESGAVLTAHTADDRVENFFMRSIVGAGPGALRGMDRASDMEGMRVVRPLLECSHQELCEWLADGGRGWQEDATNAADDAFRTYVRHHIVPAAKEKNAQLCTTLGRTMDLIADEDDYLNALTHDLVHLTAEPLEGGGFLLQPLFGQGAKVLQRRGVFALLTEVLREADPDARVENASVEAVLAGFAQGKPVSGYVANIQGNLAVSANKQGVRVEPMAAFRARRKKD